MTHGFYKQALLWTSYTRASIRDVLKVINEERAAFAKCKNVKQKIRWKDKAFLITTTAIEVTSVKPNYPQQWNAGCIDRRKK